MPLLIMYALFCVVFLCVQGSWCVLFIVSMCNLSFCHSVLGYCFICKRWWRIERELKTKEKDNITQGINCCGDNKKGREKERRRVGG